MIPSTVTHIKLKPLMPIGGRRIDPGKVLRSLQRRLLKSLRDHIYREAFSSRAKRALARGIKVRVGKSSIKLIATHPAFYPLVRGQRKGQMGWLVKAKRPIPIVLDDGTLIFRSATARSMRDGKWIHPGHAPTTMVERAREEARAIVKERLLQEIRRQTRAKAR